ncbi:MAG: nickel-dependent hydrogenase large subunit [Hadesarchaea archaeon]|nr:nickel-dependent hydrogenase large subunit [Hadesarchaea archaeon]
MFDVVKVGPYHPLLLEPELYEITVRDGKITDVGIRQGYTHRGIERLMESKSFVQDVFLAERVCGLCSQAHSTAYCQAVEKIFGAEVPARARNIRSLVFEMDRLHSHYMWFGLFFHTLHNEGQFIKIINARESLMDLIESICGNRVHFSINSIGGVRRDVTKRMLAAVKSLMGDLETLTDDISRELRNAAPKLSGLGPLPRDKARAYGVVGPVLRASGVESDIRKDDPYAAYGEVDFEIPTEEEGDVFSRALVRARETLESVKIIRQLIERMPKGEISVDIREPLVGEDFSRVEAPRGELIYYVRSNGTNYPERVKLRPPTYMNDRAVVEMLCEQKLADFPVILESLDRCISCTNRVTVVDERTGRSRRVTLDELRGVVAAT